MPEKARRSTTCGVCTGRPRPRLLPPAMSSSGSSCATAAATISTSSRSSLGAKRVISEPRQLREGDLAVVDMHAAELGAAMEFREDLAGIEQPVRVEGTFEALLMVEIDLVEHRWHQVALLDADAVLAGEHAAHLDAEAQDVRAEGFGALELAGIVGVVEDERVEIAVAGMEDIGNAQPMLLRQLAHMRQHLGQPLARNCAVNAVVIGRDAADRRESRFAPGPEGEPLLLAVRDAQRHRIV